MSVIEKIQNLFKPKIRPPEDSMDMASVGMPVDPFATGAMQASIAAPANLQDDGGDDGFAVSRLAAADDLAPLENPDLLRLPILGNRTIAQHQRTLLILLGLSVLVLAVVAYRALTQADTVAQEVAATGQSLKIGRAHV